MVSPLATAEVRLDVWLWAARFFRTRGLAKLAIEAGRVEVQGQVVGKAAKAVRVGDGLVLRRGDERFELRVLGLGEGGGSAAAAQALYAESDDSRAQRESAAARRRDERAGYQAPDSKPDKKARRLIRALGDIDAF